MRSRSVVAKTLDDALDFVANESIDLALLESRFEGDDCLELIAKIRALNPTSRIVVHTWLADVRATVAVVKASADDLLPKPLDVAFVVAFLLDGHNPESGSLENIPDIETVRRAHILTVFQWCDRNLSLASRQLCLNRRSLQRLMQRYRQEAGEKGYSVSTGEGPV
ncbi:response regulator [Rhizobium cauense]|uniref:response regulator n=1 Tax=Rhizobium cauense TaxID=1166683 RepID=UPI001C6E0D5B|nr:response regulator [Rhizobium cauense]MBW9113874.1 response regulator [Rhizobium cauense]